MSKIIDLQIQCPDCGQQYQAKAFRTLWGDGCTADDFTSRLTENTNMVTCPHCGRSFRLPLGLMYVDVKAGFAVWYEPQFDSNIDDEARQYAAMFGADSYYAKAPRIKDWEEFKRTIWRYYTGELKANPITKFDFGPLKQHVSKSATPHKKSGCLGVLLLLIFPIALGVVLM